MNALYYMVKQLLYRYQDATEKKLQEHRANHLSTEDRPIKANKPMMDMLFPDTEYKRKEN